MSSLVLILALQSAAPSLAGSCQAAAPAVGANPVAAFPAAVDGSTRTIQAAGPPFSKKPNTDSAHTPLDVAGPNTRT